MAGKNRSGLANHRRAYGCPRYCPITQQSPVVTSYTVTYNGNQNTDGSAPIDGSSPYTSGSIVTVLGKGSLVRIRYTFTGWNTSEDGLGRTYSQGSTFTINSNITLYALWVRNSPLPDNFTVTYEGNNNTNGNPPLDSSQYNGGSVVTVLGNSGEPVLEKRGSTFTGWNTEADYSGTHYVQGNTFIINSNKILYAVWTPTSYTVTYNGNNNTSGNAPTDASSPYEFGSSVIVLGNSGEPVLENVGFDFAGWNTEADGSGTPYVQGDAFEINANITLYAVWTSIRYAVTYNGNNNTSGNAPTDGSSPYEYGSIVTVFGNSGFPVLAKTGFAFAGWNTAADGLGTSYLQGDTFIINTDTTLYARWTVPPPSTPTALSSVGGNTEAYILFTQSGTITNYEYSTDNGATFLAFNPPQIYSPVNIKELSSDGITPLTNGITYTVKLKAVNSGVSSTESVSVDVVPTVTSLLTANRIIYLDARNPSSYSGSGATWTNLDSGGAYSATLQNSPTFDNINKWFSFDGINQIAQIAAASGINPTRPFSPFTIQIWARVNTASPNFGSSDGLISKQFGLGGGYDGYSLSLNKASGAVTLNMNGGSVNGNYSSSTGVYSNEWALYTIVVRFGGGSGNPSYTYVSTRRVVTANNGETSMPSSTAPLQFPRGIQETNSNFCPADVGAFYVYNTALSQETVIQNFDAIKHTYI